MSDWDFLIGMVAGMVVGGLCGFMAFVVVASVWGWC